jgi:hypothetical protein
MSLSIIKWALLQRSLQRRANVYLLMMTTKPIRRFRTPQIISIWPLSIQTMKGDLTELRIQDRF